MPRTTLALTSFVSGELGAKLDGRTDFAKYSTGAKTLENFLIHPQGSATRRVGTQFIAEVKNSAAKTRLIPFEFSTVQTYILEFGNQYITNRRRMWCRRSRCQRVKRQGMKRLSRT